MNDTKPRKDQPWRDEKTGRFLAPPPNAFRITKENAKELAHKRVEIYRRKGIQYMLEEAKSIDNRMDKPSDAWGFLMGKLYVKLLDQPDSKEAYKFGQMLGILPKPGEIKAEAERSISSVDPIEQADRILSIIERAKQLADDKADVIDVTG